MDVSLLLISGRERERSKTLMGFALDLCPRRLFHLSFVLCCAWAFGITSTTASFNCSSRRTSCNALVDYLPPNSTTLSDIKSLFDIKNLRSLLGANGLPLSTLPSQAVPAKQAIRIPFRCLCVNGTGLSDKRPNYTVVSGDDLYHIAAVVFSGLVTVQEIQRVNNIRNASLILPDQKLWIPLPCSCDDVDGQQVVHYGYVVPALSTVEQIAQRYNTSQETLLRLNGLASPKDLLAGAVLDVPLQACNSMVADNSSDYPLLVPNGTYVFTANNCVRCSCDSASNWMLQCEPSQFNSSRWPSCPSMQCQGSDNLYLGNTTATSSGCNRTTCAYAGFTDKLILTTPALLDSTCSVPDDNNNAPKLSLQGRNLLMTMTIPSIIHLLLLSIRSYQ